MIPFAKQRSPPLALSVVFGKREIKINAKHIFSVFWIVDSVRHQDYSCAVENILDSPTNIG
jgi:hypothetical protein